MISRQAVLPFTGDAPGWEQSLHLVSTVQFNCTATRLLVASVCGRHFVVTALFGDPLPCEVSAETFHTTSLARLRPFHFRAGERVSMTVRCGKRPPGIMRDARGRFTSRPPTFRACLVCEVQP